MNSIQADAQGPQTPPQRKLIGPLSYSDEGFLSFEAYLRGLGFLSEDLWQMRVYLYFMLTMPPPPQRRTCFRFGVLGYLPVFARDWIRAKFNRPPAVQQAALLARSEFLFLIFGDASKEVDSLIPVAAELQKSGQAVGIAWVSEEPGTVKMPQSGIPLFRVTWGDVLRAATAGAALSYVASALTDTLRIAVSLRGCRGAVGTLWKRRAEVVSHLIHLGLWQRFFTSNLGQAAIKSVAFAADTSEPGEALAAMARTRGWRSHHFLHGFPHLVNTRSLATDIHCFSTVERDFFLDAGWLPERVHADGHPRQAAFISRIAASRTIPPEEGGLRVLFANQGVEGGYDAAHHLGTMQTVYRAVHQLALGPDEFKIRFHPMEDQTSDRIVATEHGFGSDYISNGSVVDDLAWANLVLAPWSTVAAEAAYADCCLVWVVFGTFRFQVRERLIRAGYGHVAATPEELAGFISAFKSPGFRRDRLYRQRGIARHTGILNPDAAGRAAERMRVVTSSRTQ